MAAVFGITNLGMPIPSAKEVEAAFNCDHHFRGSNKINCHNATTYLGQQFMENEYQQQIFADEACWWFKKLAKRPIEEIKRVHPEHGALLDHLRRKEKTTVSSLRTPRL